jgi:hypothetical protein
MFSQTSSCLLSLLRSPLNTSLCSSVSIDYLQTVCKGETANAEKFFGAEFRAIWASRKKVPKFFRRGAVSTGFCR